MSSYTFVRPTESTAAASGIVTSKARSVSTDFAPASSASSRLRHSCLVAIPVKGQAVAKFATSPPRCGAGHSLARTLPSVRELPRRGWSLSGLTTAEVAEGTDDGRVNGTESTTAPRRVNEIIPANVVTTVNAVIAALMAIALARGASRDVLFAFVMILNIGPSASSTPLAVGVHVIPHFER